MLAMGTLANLFFARMSSFVSAGMSGGNVIRCSLSDYVWSKFDSYIVHTTEIIRITKLIETNTS